MLLLSLPFDVSALILSPPSLLSVAIAEEEEEYYLKHDSAAKFQFNYNRVTAMSHQYPEINFRDDKIDPFNIAPGEGKSPMSILQDPEWDLKSFPHLDPTGKNGMYCEREVKLTELQFIEQRLKNINPVFSQSSSYLYALLSLIENLQLKRGIDVSVQRGSKWRKEDGSFGYKQLAAFSVFDNVSGSIR